MTRKFFPPFGVVASLACNKGNRDDNDRDGLAPALRRRLVRFGRRRGAAYGKICKLGQASLRIARNRKPGYQQQHTVECDNPAHPRSIGRTLFGSGFPKLLRGQSIGTVTGVVTFCEHEQLHS